MAYLDPITAVFPLKMNFSSIKYKPPGSRPKAGMPSTMSSTPSPDRSLTPSKERKGDYGPEFGFEPFQQRRYGEDVEEQMQETEMHQGEKIEPVHCAKDAVSSNSREPPRKRSRPWPNSSEGARRVYTCCGACARRPSQGPASSSQGEETTYSG